MLGFRHVVILLKPEKPKVSAGDGQFTVSESKASELWMRTLLPLRGPHRQNPRPIQPITRSTATLRTSISKASPSTGGRA